MTDRQKSLKTYSRIAAEVVVIVAASIALVILNSPSTLTASQSGNLWPACLIVIVWLSFFAEHLVGDLIFLVKRLWRMVLWSVRRIQAGNPIPASPSGNSRLWDRELDGF